MSSLIFRILLIGLTHKLVEKSIYFVYLKLYNLSVLSILNCVINLFCLFKTVQSVYFVYSKLYNLSVLSILNCVIYLFGLF